MTTIFIISALVLFLAIGLICYAVFWVKHSVNPNDYPWLKQTHALNVQERELWLSEQTNHLLKKMTLKEKIAQLSGDGSVFVLVRLGINIFLLKRFPNIYSGRNARLNIPPFSFSDGPRGIVVGKATGFPVAMARAASWDTALESRVASALGIEARASGANYFGGLCINLLRHPAWGRAQECFGEDPFLTAEFASAVIQGVQQHNVMACAKHFAVNNIENSRFYVDVQIDKRTLHEVYLPHFKRCSDEGIASIMSAYNKLNGEYCGHNEYLLNQVLREQWGFKGFVSSDWLWGIYKTKEAVIAGMDVEMPYARFFGRNITKAIKRKELDPTLVDRNAERVIRTKLDFISREDPQSYSSELLANTNHKKLAQDSAEQSMVLLKNEDNCLPLNLNSIKSIAVIGKLAKENNLGDHGSSRTSPPAVCSLYQGLEFYLKKHHPDISLHHHDGTDQNKSEQLSKQADVVLIVAGYRANEEGENLTSNHTPPSSGGKQKVATGGDRLSLSLPNSDIQLIETVSQHNENCIVNIVAGSAVLTTGWDQKVKSILMTWYPGMEGGHAWANILAGVVSPSGKLPFSIPELETQLTDFDAFEETAYYSYLHGYTHLEKNNTPAKYPFGFGLSYSKFEFNGFYANINEEQQIIQVTVDIKNIGSMPAAEVIQVYVDFTAIEKITGIERPNKLLKAFSKVFLSVGEQKTVNMIIDKNELNRFDPEINAWCFDPGEYIIKVGNSSDELKLLSQTLIIN